MKFSDILQGVGLIRSEGGGSHLNISNGGKVAQIPGADVERLHQDYQTHHIPHPYHQQMNLGLGPAIGSFYYPPAHAMYGQRGYGLRLGAGGHTHGTSAGGGNGHGGGYGHTGYGGYTGGSSGAGYEHGYFTGRQKSKGSSNCLKEHMDTMNPTVMVMTAGVARNRLNKFVEVNSREITDKVNRENVQLSHQNEGGLLYPNASTMGETKIEPKLKNDYFRDGNTFYMRIN